MQAAWSGLDNDHHVARSRDQKGSDLMPTLFGSLRRFLLTPPLNEVSFTRRGFPVGATRTTERLEAIPHAVVCGFEWGIDAYDCREVERRLVLVEPAMRGFFYEGVAMAFTVRDAFRGHRTRDLAMGVGRPYIFLTLIGIGFAMARLPRAVWHKVLPDLTGSPYYPAMSWLAVDGYGFSLAYCDKARWVDAQEVPPPYPWAGSPDYFPRAVDQGVGRALWFIHGGQTREVADAVLRFPRWRHADLWSGVGLAAAFMGGSGVDDLAVLLLAAGEHQAELGLGAVLAAKARAHSGHVPDYTAATLWALASLTVTEADALAESMGLFAVGDGSVPQYEVWRHQVRTYIATSRERLAD
jgi:hypothetical protein